jgi:glutamine transport system permease protein
VDFRPRPGRRLIIGLVAGFARCFGGWIANHIALVFIEIIRGTPIVVQVMFIYFALPMAFSDLRIDPSRRRS